MNLAVTPSISDIPADLLPAANAMHDKLVERIAELDDDLTMKYLEGEDISVADLKKVLRAAVIANKATPIFCGSSLKNKGVQPLLDAMIDYLPSPQMLPR